MRYAWSLLCWRLRWWKWFLNCPSPVELIERGLDKQSRRLVYDRYDAKEPVRPIKD